MKLYKITRKGNEVCQTYTVHIVRAADEEQAFDVADEDPKEFEIEELLAEGEPEVILSDYFMD